MDGHRTAPGTPLTDLLSGGPVGHVRAARVGLGVLDVLAAAHAEGLPHGELGPGQVWTDEFGTVTVTGFGQADSGDAPRLTAPAYASPEQARGEGGAAAADLWALGAMMYAMTEGRPAVRDRGGWTRRSGRSTGCRSGRRCAPDRSRRPSRACCAGTPWNGFRTPSCASP